MRKLTVILSIFALIASGCGGSPSTQTAAAMPETIAFEELQEKEGKKHRELKYNNNDQMFEESRAKKFGFSVRCIKTNQQINKSTIT